MKKQKELNWAINSTILILIWHDTCTFALIIRGKNSLSCRGLQRFCSNFTGKERDEETGYGYFGARYMDHELMTMWLSVDPMADKYPSISPYAYCAWNPVRLVDPDGREIILPSGRQYEALMDVSELDVNDAAVANALNAICKSDEGLLMMDELCNSCNSIFIDLTDEEETGCLLRGKKDAYYDTEGNKPGTGDINVNIWWNSDNPAMLPTLDGMKANATYDLLDEICHAYDAVTGYATKELFGDNWEKSEYQAVYRSNVVRHQLKDYNYRTKYYVNQDGSMPGPTMADKFGFYRPFWYPRASTDNNISIESQMER